MRPPWAWRRKPLKLPKSLGGEPGAGRPCVVHLVRKANGLDSLREFAGAYRLHPPGIDCELVLAMKGFASPAELAPYLDEVADLAPATLFLPDRGFDQGVYLAAAVRLRRERYCFVNSHGRPRVDGWLAKLSAALDRPGVGMVSPTGHWASAHSWLMYSMGLPSAYRGLMPPRGLARERFLAIELEQKGMESRSAADRLRARLISLRDLPEGLVDFEPFPARNLRPNAFMITHATLREMRLFVVCSKLDTYVLEGSRASYTRQVEAMGLFALVVDSAGTVYGPGEWDRSCTFWQGDQERLLVADNQTHAYARGDRDSRRLLSTFAWGPSADPGPSREDSPEDLTFQS
jgi:hypothetical protein